MAAVQNYTLIFRLPPAGHTYIQLPPAGQLRLLAGYYTGNPGPGTTRAIHSFHSSLAPACVCVCVCVRVQVCLVCTVQLHECERGVCVYVRVWVGCCGYIIYVGVFVCCFMCVKVSGS